MNRATPTVPAATVAETIRTARQTGRFGLYGGRYVAETLMPALDELEQAWARWGQDSEFRGELDRLLREYVGRPTPLTFAARLSDQLGLRVYLKREDLCHTGAHKINNSLGQGLLARKLGKRRLIAETGAGQHGVATATVAALLGFECEIFMGLEDTRRQSLNVFRMKLLGATVSAVDQGTKTLKDALNEALRNWVSTVRDTHYLIGSATGPHPFPSIVAELQSVIGREAREQVLRAEGRLPDVALACVGGGSNAIGLFRGFVEDESVELLGIEAAGEGVTTGRHSATLGQGRVGILHGSKSYVLADEDGQIQEAHSVSAGLDYPGVGPEHAYLRDSGRARYEAISDREALAAVERMARSEGILCALETAHAVAALEPLARRKPGALVVLGLSGRGDKDVGTLTSVMGLTGGAA
jgi:tryptophan synthase beta chain